MKRYFSFFMLLSAFVMLFTFTAFASDNLSDEDTGLSLSIETDKDAYEGGDEVNIKISITNTSSFTYNNLKYDISVSDNITFPEKTKTNGVFTVNSGSAKNISITSEAIPETATTTDDSNKFPIAAIIAIVVIIVIAVIAFILIKKKKAKNIPTSILLFALIAPFISTINAHGDLNDVTLSGTKEITINGENATITVTIDCSEGKQNMSVSNIGIHDPSVFQDPVSGMYYSYGSHIVAGSSSNLISWNYIASSSSAYGTANSLFSKHYLEEFKEVYDWLGSDVIEGIWALDVTYSKAADDAGNDPYFMYVTVVNGSFKSALCLATSDKPEGPFSYKGMIVCSDYRQSEVNAGHTNLLEVLGVNSVSDMTPQQKSYYFKSDSASYKASLPDCIDAAPFYDKDGNLYLTYGSFTTKGGLRVLKLDAKTGLRSDDTYEFKADGSSDPYYGIKIANANGEGPYILRVDTDMSSTGSYYFLFWSQGNLRATGGYNMRMFRSEYPDKGYVDYAGQSALDSISATNLGIRIMDGFKFSTMAYPSTANGGNSAIVTNEGKIFVHYHSKSSSTTAYGENGFIIKSNQMFLNEDGWLVTTPYKYMGETISTLTKEDIIGDYEFIYHRLQYYKDPADITDNYVSSTLLTLNDDGTVSGSHTGTWEMKENYITITIDNKIYKGVVLEQYDESNSREKTIVFTASGSDNRTIWGSKINLSAKERVASDLTRINAPSEAMADFTLDTVGLMNSDITWTSNNSAIVIEGNIAKVIGQDSDQTVTLTATATFGSESESKTFEITVPAEEFNIPSTISTDYIFLPSATSAGKKITWSSSDTNVIDPITGKVNIQSSTVKVTLTGTVEGSDRVIATEINVMPLPTNVIYSDNYDELASIDASKENSKWFSTNAAAAVTLKSDANGGKYVEFAPGSANSRGAISTFDAKGQVDGVYVIDFDLALTAGDNQTTEFAVTTENMAYLNNVINDGIESGYLFKLSGNANSTTWSVNDGDTFDIAAGKWMHINAIADTETGTVILTITCDNETIYSGTVTMNASGTLRGFYIRGGRYNSVTCVDNVTVKKN